MLKHKVYGQVDPALTLYQVLAGSLLVIGFTGSLSRLAGETVVGSPYAIGQNTVANSNYTITYVSELSNHSSQHHVPTYF
jgi:hypothetical protein